MALGAMLSLRSVCKHFAGHCVINDITLTLNAGEFVALVGPSGCGKSTLLRLLMGLDSDYTGGVQCAAQHLAAVFQSPRLMPWLSALENIRLVLAPERRAQAEPWLRRVGLEDFAQHYPAALSGGMQRRLALARAFSYHPELLLLDEPFVSLDQPTAMALRQLLAELCAGPHMSALMVTHDLDEALQLADRIVFLTASPARILLDESLDGHRPRSSEAVIDLRQHLLTRYPALLHGSLEFHP